ncbi:MAG: hypothetical protein LUI07_02360 [Lachnospiraceae bacterium]|nr:hypothetical protein [Lachnospiraceae bacterium]
MGRLSTPVKIILAVLSAAGVVGAFLFLRNETVLEQNRQSIVSQLSEELLPINEERNDWEAQEEEWLENLEAAQKGKPCVVLCFAYEGATLYNLVYTSMLEYGFTGVFALKNGVIPGEDDEDYIDSDDMEEMLDYGWEYALYFADETVYGDEDADDSEASVTETVTYTGQEWLNWIDSFQDTLIGYGMTASELLLCTQEQYDSVADSSITSRGFTTVVVADEESFPGVSEIGDDYWKIDSGVYTQEKELEDELGTAINNGESVVIFINEVVRIAQDTGYSLRSSKLSSLLSYLKEQEEQENLQVCTLSELYKYEAEREETYDSMLKEYAAFREEMNEALDELDAEEEALVEKAHEMTLQE